LKTPYLEVLGRFEKILEVNFVLLRTARLGMLFPNTIRTNDYYRQKYPELVTQSKAS
jgi:hypothetical protein